MLLRFEVGNHRSIMESVELSMIAVDDDRAAARPFDMLSEKVLTVAGIYGANASGKSNVLDALRWLSAAVRLSLRSWTDAIPRDPFRFRNGHNLTTRFVVAMMVDGVRYEYELEVKDKSVVFEALYSFPKRLRRTLFERDGMELYLRRGLGVSGMRGLMTPTTLALSAAMRFETSKDIGDFGRKLAGIGVLAPSRRPIARRPGAFGQGFAGAGGRVLMPPTTTRIFMEHDGMALNQVALLQSEDVGDVDSRDMALGLLRFADLGIDDVEVVTPTDGDRESRPYLRLLHHSNGERVAFEMFDESEGTQTWFRLIGPTLRALGTGQLLVFDEIDASLHPRLSARLLELFQDPDTNPLGAQLIFTTHDTSLLNHLNRDEVWLTEKHESGSTALTALAEYGGDKVRRSLNLERAYLQGRFGAVPELDQHQLRAALGVAVGRAEPSDGLAPVAAQVVDQEQAMDDAVEVDRSDATPATRSTRDSLSQACSGQPKAQEDHCRVVRGASD